MISLIDVMDSGYLTAERVSMETRHREMRRKAERLYNEAEDLHDEARDLESQAEKIEDQIEAEIKKSDDGTIAMVATWAEAMLRCFRVSPLVESRLHYAIEHGDERVIRAVGVLYQVPLPCEFYPAVPDRSRVARGSVADLPLFTGRID